jgi:RNA polymerase sigma-70 factor (ECF subfamily)
MSTVEEAAVITHHSPAEASTVEEAAVITHHSPAEALNAIGSLSTGDKAALMKVARIYARLGRSRYDHEDLLHEAFARVLEGTRRWPTGVAFMPFMCWVMRGIASDWRVGGENSGGRNEDPGEEEAATAVSGEGEAVAKIDAQKLVGLFNDDPAAQKLLIGMMEGARGEELWESSGLTKTDYDSKRRKIRRRIERLWLNLDAERNYGGSTDR